MRVKITVRAIALFASAVTGVYPACAKAQVSPPVPSGEAYKYWANCMTKEGKSLEPSKGTPEDIAIAAAEKCTPYEIDYVGDTVADDVIKGIPRDVSEARIDRVHKEMKNKAIAAVIESRAANANR